ncbi:holo-[acyl-carrier-protein] synthase [Xylophilus rhododendri]|uniref:Holo-[acyl-carrier-protein] synthase n=1 Tax=Xylophilus rhododendri TaxID=2697032 RepID=A0A857J3S5_9BURK|nr:holo-ACP synthase [Xylophilus rhododendri]QHI98590.1 holo-[acyl-carrier-protein] synthase [Xylophilus rhododendri]
MVQVRIGTDLIEVASIAESCERFGRRYLERIFTPDEIAYCEAGGEEMAQRLAARFAAKEACMKVLRPVGGGIPWRSIEVVKTPEGWVELKLHDSARRLADAAGIVDLSLSLSHERSMAIAVVAATIDS